MVGILDVETAVRARDIIKNAFRVDKKNTKYVSPASYDRTKTGFKIGTVTKIPGQRARRHVVRCDMEPGYVGLFNRCPHVRVDCSCERYLFVWNYALNQVDSAIRDRTNGEPPIDTNPAENPGICKHGLIALTLLIRTNPMWDRPAPPAKSSGDRIRLSNLDTTLKRVRRGKP